MNGYFTRFELTPSGWTGAICRQMGDVLAGRLVIEFGSKSTVRRALRKQWRIAARARAQVC
ncbi:hypothetical protein [Roseateles terrae]|uniref:Uncharacterized protein n=1 Tax=Roseateles terrae TaxID=431060 RepID=A0ABR6GPE5_9BURK|nr:hypothetical protein [Roseateles terrae]MBB3193984.1 hypothetical protein [Roseateles terrae]OWQ87857.1 hypothetical protein CDN98_06740 [Roseateles terrae]